MKSLPGGSGGILGGGSKGGKVTSQTASNAIARIVEVVSEGPCQGPLKPGSQWVYLDETPVQNADGTFNFYQTLTRADGSTYQVQGGIGLDYRTGTLAQTYMPGFADTIDTETQLGIEVKHDIPQTRTFNNANCDLIKVRLLFNLQHTDHNNNQLAQDVHFQISISQGGGGNQVRLDTTVSMRTSGSGTELQYKFPVSNNGGITSLFGITITKIDGDSTVQTVTNQIIWQSFTQSIETKLNYPMSGVVGVSFQSQLFNQVPKRQYLWGGILCQIPNVFAVNASDGGLDYQTALPWGGLLYQPAIAPSDPAWQLYDLLTNTRYGAGQWVNPSQLNKWTFYAISQRCNELVSNGMGGQERRFSCNIQIKDRAKAADLIKNMLSIFNGLMFWSGGTLQIDADMPKTPTKELGQTDVVDGIFHYQGTALRARHTRVLVTWHDPTNLYKEATECVDDQDGIIKYGVREIRIDGFGITSRGQARRAGLWMLTSERIETEVMTCTVDFKGAYFVPGEIVQVFDPNRNYGIRLSGRLKASTQTVLNLDAPVSLTDYNYQVSVTMPDMSLVTVPVAYSGLNTTVLNLITALPQVPVVGATWILASQNFTPVQYRVLSVRPVEGVGKYQITASLYCATKDNIIAGKNILPPPRVPNIPPTVPVPPSSVTARSILVTSGNSSNTLSLYINWAAAPSPFINSYLVQYRVRGSIVWSNTLTVNGTNTQVNFLAAGDYDIQVASVDLTGKQSNWVPGSSSVFGPSYYAKAIAVL